MQPAKAPAGTRQTGAGRRLPLYTPADPPGETDLLKWPLLGPFLRWRHARTALQLPLLVLAVVMIGHGLFGPRLAPRNLATLLTWVHYRGALIIALLVAGNIFCMACPFMLPRNLARRFVTPTRHWPRQLRNKGVAIALLVATLFAYEAFDLWGSPWWTAWLIVAYFAAALLVDSLFQQAPFCKWVCPIGQFNFIAATVSPLEVRVSDPTVCASCTTLDCIRGTRDAEQPALVVQRGCELALFQPRKRGNMDCTFCLDCVHACPHDNVAIGVRLPGSELFTDPIRSGVGRLSQRPDLSLLALVFTFGAILNAFAMVSPVYTFQRWVGSVTGTSSGIPGLGTLFVLALIVEPVVLVGLAAFITRSATGTHQGLLPLATRFSYCLVPLGLGIWAAHYGFHLLTGLFTAVPVSHAALHDLGVVHTAPSWGVGGVPAAIARPIEIGLVGLGAVGSLLVAWRIAEREFPARAAVAFLPWAVLCAMLWVAATWLMTLPMEMRGSVMGA
ncbi:MAG: FesM [Gemmatimonadota bacterium]